MTFLKKIFIIVVTFTYSQLEAQPNILKALSISQVLSEKGYQNDSLYKIAEEIYLNAIKLDSMDLETNYNFGVFYYNRGAYIANILNSKGDTLSKSVKDNYLNEMNFYIDKSKPYLQKWYLYRKNELEKSDKNPTQKP